MTFKLEEPFSEATFEDAISFLYQILGIHGFLAALDPETRKKVVLSAALPSEFYEVFTEEEQENLIRFFMEYGDEGLYAGSEHNSSNQ